MSHTGVDTLEASLKACDNEDPDTLRFLIKASEQASS